MNAPQAFTNEQQAYLQGLMLGTDVARKVRELPVLSDSASLLNATTLRIGGNPSNLVAERPAHLPLIHYEALQRTEMSGKQLSQEEKAKRDKSGLGMWQEIASRAESNEYPKGTDVFLTKYHGLFFVAPAQNSYMCRMRLPGGILRSDQLTGIANIADRFAGGCVDVTTRANLQLREIEAKNAVHVLMGLRDLGVVTQGSGADNVRNITASTLSGIDPHELIETLPLARELHYHILNKPELYGLPRKFNIAFDGSGTISSLAETNDISFHAVQVSSGAGPDLEAGIYFLLGLGGITGHGDFAKPTSILVAPKDCIRWSEAILRVFIRHGDRTDRKRSRLKYLLDAWGHERFLNEVASELGIPITPVAAHRFELTSHIDRWAHVDVHPQKQQGQCYVGIVLPVGRLTSDQCRGLSDIARRFGSGQLRLTVWQNLIVPDIHEADVVAVQEAIERLGLEWKASSVRAGLVACTGNAGCKYAASNTKLHAMQIAAYLDEKLTLDRPINIHLTGCHHSCAQHAIGDIGLIATKVEMEEEMVEGYHILIGGRTGIDPAIGVTLFESVPATEVAQHIEALLLHYLQHRTSGEGFDQFSTRTDWKSVKPLLVSELVSAD